MTRFTWAIVIGVLALVIVSIVLAATLDRTGAPPDPSTPEGVALAYALAVQRGDPEDAWELLASSVKSQTTRDRFLVRASDLRGTYERARLSFENVRVEGDTARLELVRTYPASGGLLGVGSGSYSNRNTVRLVREEGDWRISAPPEPFILNRLP